jgi:hypothetical protein
MKLFLGLPVYGAYNAHFVHSMFALITQRPCPMIIRPCVGDSLVARARNRLCAQFLASDCTHMLQLDTDLIFSPEHIAKLIHHAEAGHDIIAGLYPKKQKELGWVCNVLDQPEPDRPDGLQRVKYAGTGCLMVSRAVLLAMINQHPEIEYDPDEGDESGVKHDFFATGVRAFEGRRRYLSEDWMFCQRALDLGFDIMMDTTVILKHVGEMIYPLQAIESFAQPHG